MKTVASIQNIALGSAGNADLGRMPLAPGLVQLSPQMNVEQLFELIADNCLAQIKAHATTLVQSYDVEALHQMRVGLRRLRVALDLFKRVLQLPALLQQELEWLNVQLSAARDWDVLAASTLPLLTTELPEVYQQMIKLPAVKRSIHAKARQQHKAALAALSSQRYLSLMLQLASWLDSRGWRSTLTVKRTTHLLQPGAKFARNRLRQQQQRLAKRGQRLGSNCARRLHRLRIAAKTMRYATEFFQSLYARKLIRPSMNSLSRLQQHLGSMHDAAVADVLLQQLAQQRPQLAASLHLIRAYMRLRFKSQASTISAWSKKYSRCQLAI